MAVKPLPPDLLEWFKDHVRARTYERVQYDASLSPVTIRRVLETGQASAGVIARIEALRGGQVTREPNMREREQIAAGVLESIISNAFEALPPDRRRAMLKLLGPKVAEHQAVRMGALKPLNLR